MTRDSTNEIVAVGAPMSAVPYCSRLWSTVTTNGAQLVTWENFVLGRVPSTSHQPPATNHQLVSAQIELRANGDFIARSNEVETVYRYIDPFDNDGDGILDDQDWDPRWWDGDYTGQPEGWVEYVDEMVGTGLENGYYKLTATFPSGYFRRTVLSVGDERIIVADPGKYVFLLEKGNEYEIGLEPFVEGVEFDAVDDIPVADGLMRSQMAPQGRWEGKWTRDEGRLYLAPPLMSVAGWIMWTPKLCVSPDTWNPSVGDRSETFTAMFFDRTDMMGEPTSYSWTSPNNSVDFGSPTRVTTLATWQMGAQDTIAAHLIVSFGLLQLESTLAFEYVEEGEGSNPNVVCWMEELPDTLFLNNDNDLGNPEADYWYYDVGDDDWQLMSVFAGLTWTLYNESERSIPLYFNASGKSSGFETSQIKVRWIPEVGPEKTFVKRFTVVEPVAEPVCTETKAVTENGETRNVAYNPCGVAVGRDAYYKIEVKPTAYPDSMIAWETSGEGSVQFVGGNRGREVRVRGVSPGDVTLSAKLGNSVSSPPSFTLRVVTNRTIRLSAWIIANKGVQPRSENEVQEMVKVANDIYAQVGVSFDLGDRITVTNIPAAYVINEIHETEGHWNLGRLTALASGTGGLECYFVNEIIDDAPNARSDSPIVGIHSNSGLAIASAGNGVTLSHEIGHAFGLNDIYNETRSGVELMGFVSEDMMVQDWNGGSGGNGQSGARYYPFGKFRRDLVRDLLMDGWKEDIGKGIDIPFGAIKGYNLQGEDDFVFVGFFYPPALQSPTHQ